jgi:hypothetical protein
MNKIWVFGDSFSVPYSSSCLIPTGKMYIDYKGYEPKIYSDLLSEHYNVELFNFSRGGISNQEIFKNFRKNYNKIGLNDIVIFNWTVFTRFMYVNDGVWTSSNYHAIGSNEFVDGIRNKMFEEKNQKKYIDEIYEIMDFIDSLLITQKVFHWTYIGMEYQSINDETNGLVKDFHFCEEQHKKMFETIVEIFKENEKYRMVKSLI